eukprot:7142327-Karenia_brevis.AAC.1
MVIPPPPLPPASAPAALHLRPCEPVPTAVRPELVPCPPGLLVRMVCVVLECQGPGNSLMTTWRRCVL